MRKKLKAAFMKSSIEETLIWWTRSKSTTGTEKLCMHSMCRKISWQKVGLIEALFLATWFDTFSLNNSWDFRSLNIFDFAILECLKYHHKILYLNAVKSLQSHLTFFLWFIQ